MKKVRMKNPKLGQVKGFKTQAYRPLKQSTNPDLTDDAILHWYEHMGGKEFETKNALIAGQIGSAAAPYISKFTEKDIDTESTESIFNVSSDDLPSQLDFSDRNDKFLYLARRLKTCINIITKFKTLNTAKDDPNFQTHLNYHELEKYEKYIETEINRFMDDEKLATSVHEYMDFSLMRDAKEFVDFYSDIKIDDKFEFMKSSVYNIGNFPVLPYISEFKIGYILHDTEVIPDSFRTEFHKMLIRVKETMTELYDTRYIAPTADIKNMIKVTIHKVNTLYEGTKIAADLFDLVKSVLFSIYDEVDKIYKVYVDGGTLETINYLVSVLTETLQQYNNKMKIYTVMSQGKQIVNVIFDALRNQIKTSGEPKADIEKKIKNYHDLESMVIELINKLTTLSINSINEIATTDKNDLMKMFTELQKNKSTSNKEND